MCITKRTRIGQKHSDCNLPEYKFERLEICALSNVYCQPPLTNELSRTHIPTTVVTQHKLAV